MTARALSVAREKEQGQPAEAFGRRKLMLEVVEAQVQRDVLLQRQLLQAPYYHQHVNHRAMGSERTLFLPPSAVAFVAFIWRPAMTLRSTIASVCHDVNATIVAILRPILFFSAPQPLHICIVATRVFPSTQRLTLVENVERVQLSSVI